MPKGVHLPRAHKLCARCGKPFSHAASDTDRRHCSYACARPRPAPIPSITCLWCHREYQPSRNRPEKPRQFCSSSCGRRWHNEQRKQKNGSIDRVTLRRERGARCECCGWNAVPEVLEVHHRDRNRKHNTRENLLLLCPTCHALDHFYALDGQFKNNLGRRVGAAHAADGDGQEGAVQHGL
jgi:hypothetical protein